MKFAVGVRVQGRIGAFQGLQGRITSRIKVGSQNLLVIRWSDGRESRVTTAGVTVIADGALNNQAAPLNEANLDLQIDGEDGDGPRDDISEHSETSEEGSVGDLGDQDGSDDIFNFYYLCEINELK
jgi:hypothetical protein